MECFVLEGHEEDSGDLARELDLSGLNVTVKLQEASPNPTLETQNGVNGRPVFRVLGYFGMGLSIYVKQGDNSIRIKFLT